jgi:hypothetical protein
LVVERPGALPQSVSMGIGVFARVFVFHGVQRHGCVRSGVDPLVWAGRVFVGCLPCLHLQTSIPIVRFMKTYTLVARNRFSLLLVNSQKNIKPRFRNQTITPKTVG